MITIDGSMHEGGGQIVRTSLALSALTGQPFRISSIRNGRPAPGLKAQHLAAVTALQDWTAAKVAYASLGSETLEFFPGVLPARTVSVDVGTAGSLPLLLQSLLVPALFADGRVRFRLTGGTDVRWSPPVDYCMNVFLPQVRKFCKTLDVQLLRRGLYPQGGGRLEVRVVPLLRRSEFSTTALFLEQLRLVIPPVHLAAQGELVYVKGVSFASADLQKAGVAERQASAARTALARLDCNVQVRTEYNDTLSTGSGVVLWAVFAEGGDISMTNPVILGGDALGEKGLRAELVGQQAAQQLLEALRAGHATDAYLADQLVPFLGLVGGRLNAPVTPHARANVYTVERFLGRPVVVQGGSMVV